MFKDSLFYEEKEIILPEGYTLTFIFDQDSTERAREIFGNCISKVFVAKGEDAVGIDTNGNWDCEELLFEMDGGELVYLASSDMAQFSTCKINLKK